LIAIAHRQVEIDRVADRAPTGAGEELLLRQRIEVPPGGGGGDLQGVDELGHRHFLVLSEEVEDQTEPALLIHAVSFSANNVSSRAAASAIAARAAPKYFRESTTWGWVRKNSWIAPVNWVLRKVETLIFVSPARMPSWIIASGTPD